MQLIRHLNQTASTLTNSVLTLGNFDGFHRGHQALLSTAQTIAEEAQLTCALLTFEPQPKEFFNSNTAAPRLSRFIEKYHWARVFGMDALCCLTFNKTLQHMPPEQFAEDILINALGAKALVIGNDFRFGAKRAGDANLLHRLGARLGFVVKEVPPVLMNTQRISSTRIRTALASGDLDDAKQLLGRAYSLEGRVNFGKQLGRTLGFPTANILLHRKKLPLSGVFAVTIEGLGHPQQGVANIGIRPTINGKQPLLEVHLFEFKGDLYGKRLRIHFHHQIRSEKRFDSLSALKDAIANDCEQAKAYFQLNR